MEPGAAAKPPQSSSRSSNQQQPESNKPAEYVLKKYLLR
jgi:hypothetical protein